MTFFEKYISRRWCKEFVERKIVFSGICLAVAAAVCLTGWDSIKSNWVKEDIRGVVSKWYEVNGYNDSTLVYYGADTGFYYYCEHDERYDKSMLDHVIFMKWYRNMTLEEYQDYLNELYGGNWPVSLYVAGSHIMGDMETILHCFTDHGYTASDVFNQNGGRLVYLTQND